MLIPHNWNYISFKIDDNEYVPGVLEYSCSVTETMINRSITAMYVENTPKTLWHNFYRISRTSGIVEFSVDLLHVMSGSKMIYFDVSLHNRSAIISTDVYPSTWK